MTRLDDLRIVKDLLADSRRYHWLHVGISGVMWVYFGLYVYRVGLDTTWAKLFAVFFVSSSITELVLIRNLLRLRTKAPVVAALLEQPEEIASVTGWPAKMKFPDGKYPGLARIATRSGALATVRLTPDRIHVVVGALHARSPDATIAVQNVVLAPRPSDPSRG
jgi:hypothetical protein